MGQNPMQMIQMLSRFASGYKGDPQKEAMAKIQEAGLNQQQLNQLQNQANQLYQIGKQFGVFK